MWAWTAYRERLIAEHGPRWAAPSTPTFVGNDRWGHITGGLEPDSVTRAIKRISARAGMPTAWTGPSPHIGLASTARKKGTDEIAITDPRGWARHSRSMRGSMQIGDGWHGNAAAGPARTVPSTSAWGSPCARTATSAAPAPSPGPDPDPTLTGK
ncbi:MULTISPECIES: hypothetical protein [Streptomyces]|uniref:Uncharacterized protein n=1 Tax=Streptomyces canarius TaxID=285453 RepID=A0ABQ3CHA5_9ACTN|nr:hypothetical protein [Streptomyces canarius]GHA15036.1 hypothetical protein GCM10010345_19590 [Streptomyces canarius]